MKINFRTKFKDKIRYVHKKGLKETLIAQRPDDQMELSSFSQYENPQNLKNKFSIPKFPVKTFRRCVTYGIERQVSIPSLHRQMKSTVESQPISPYKKTKLIKNDEIISLSTIYHQQNALLSKNKPKYIDELYQKHRNLINMIDQKTKWKQNKKIQLNTGKSKDFISLDPQPEAFIQKQRSNNLKLQQFRRKTEFTSPKILKMKRTMESNYLSESPSKNKDGIKFQ